MFFKEIFNIIIIRPLQSIVFQVKQKHIRYLQEISLKGVLAKNERGYKLTAIATNLTSICCFYIKKIVKNDSYQRT